MHMNKRQPLRAVVTKIKAHENAVKQYIDFDVILEQNNSSSLWPEMNWAFACQINIQ